MKISNLLPIGVPPQLGGKVTEELSKFLVTFPSGGHLDTLAGPMAVKIIAAFAALEREGFDAFKKKLGN